MKLENYHDQDPPPLGWVNLIIKPVLITIASVICVIILIALLDFIAPEQWPRPFYPTAFYVGGYIAGLVVSRCVNGR